MTDYRALAQQVCAAIGSRNVNSMAAVLAAVPQRERDRMVDMAQRLERVDDNLKRLQREGQS